MEELPMHDEDGVRVSLDRVRARIDRACEQAGRNPEDVQLLLATKYVPAERVVQAIHHGAHLIGENRVQELAEKDAVLSQENVTRHFIGRLQTNKVNQVLRYVSCIQSLDRVELADKLQARLERTDQTVDVLLQINTSDETTKGGVSPGQALSLAREVAKRDRLRVRGLMTIGLLSPDPHEVRTSYRRLREVRDETAGAAIDGVELNVLSMGMSSDIELAVAEGSTMIRVGSAVFGSRPN